MKSRGSRRRSDARADTVVIIDSESILTSFSALLRRPPA